MATAVVQQNNTVQVLVGHENTTSSYSIMSELTNDNDKNLMDGNEDTSCNDVTYNPVRDDCLEKNLKDINSEVNVNKTLTEKQSDDILRNTRSDIIDDRDNKSDSGSENVSQLNNSQDLLQRDDEDKIVKLSSKKYSRILDSDSDDDDVIDSFSRSKTNVTEDDTESIIYNDGLKTKNVMKKKTRVLDSDSENESQHSGEKEEVTNKVVKKFETLVDSESDEDEIHKTEFPLEEDNKHSDSQKSNEETAKSEGCKTNKVVKRFETLVDSESDEDEDHRTESPLEGDNIHITFHKSNTKMTKSEDSRKEGNKKGSIRASKTEAMRQIHSETQRLIRESEISLPYHRPKPRTLQEFLNRKKVSAALPEASTTAFKLKMSSAIVSKILKDKEKEAEEFYKSSESEEEEETAEKNTETPSNSASIFSENNEKLMNVDTFNDKEISQYETLLNNVSKKLFTENTDMQTEDLSNPDCLSPSNDEVEKADVTDENQPIIVHNDKNIKIDVQETVDTLLDAVEHETEQIDKDNLDENFACEKIMEETHSEKSTCEIPNAIDMDISVHKNDDVSVNINNMEEESTRTEKQALDNETKDDNQNMDISDSEKGSQEAEGRVQGLPLTDLIDEDVKFSKKRLLPVIKPDIEPRLRGNPGMIIDLSCDVKPNKTGVETLLNRFFSKHTANDKVVEKVSEIDVVHVEQTADGPKVVTQALIHKQPVHEKEDPELSKPGAKLKRLKEALKLKMAMKRNEEWKQKEEELKEQEDELEEDDEYDTYNEEKLHDDSSESGESEPEENDIPMVDKKYKPGCDFADDEAEESADENEENNEMNDGDVEEDEEEDEEEEEEEEEENNCGQNQPNDNDESSSDSVTVAGNWKPKRIIKAFEDDSNSSPSKTSINDNNETKKNIFERTATDVDLFEINNDNCQSEWNSDEEGNVSVFQKNKQSDPMTQACKTPSIKTNVLDFVSPITQLTILNTNLDSDRKDSTKKSEYMFVSGSDPFSQTQTPFEKTPRSLFSPDKRTGLQKKLFDDFNSAPNEEDLMQLCSGTFPSTQLNDLVPSSIQSSSLDVSNTQMSYINKLDANISLNEENSQDFKLNLDENSTSSVNNESKTNESSNTDAPWCKLKVVQSSDDEDESSNTKKVSFGKKRPVKMLEISDDEEAENANNLQSDEEEVNDYVDYDSEENEVVVSKKNMKKVTSEFFEKEAELSESDWDSADEDEKDLDKLEVEEGDEDDIDEDKVRNQLEKIHMRQVLDQDQRDVRLLQELLFEDGDLHSDSSGRQRKFKWKNLDKLGDGEDAPRTDDEAMGGPDIQETDSELEWCRLRHERDKFLEEKKREVDVEIEEHLEKSEIFKFGVKVLKRIESEQSDKQDSSQETNKSVVEPIMPRNLSDLLNTSRGSKNTVHSIIKKRSFLSRGDEELERIAKRVRLNDTINLAPVNSKNFVFAHLSPSVKEKEKEEKKNNQEFETENELINKMSGRRKRKTTTDSTPRSIKRTKQDGNSDTRKTKLFGHT